jgi:hypothetical protein
VNATYQALWLARVLAVVQGSVPSTPLLRVDNKIIIALIKNPMLIRREEQLEVKYHLVWESEENGLIKVEFIKREEQLGDILKKLLGIVKFHGLRTNISLIDIS